jgi:TonB family protein
MIHCPNCGKLTGFKRALGFGTFFMVLLTLGLWLLVIPLYPARCVNCGLTRHTAHTTNLIAWVRRDDKPPLRACVVGAVVLALIVLVVVATNKSTEHKPASIVDGPEYLAPVQRRANSLNSAEPPLQKAQVSANVEQLMIARQTGGAAAAERYLGKIIEARGIVDTADSTGNSPSISFKATGSCAIAGGNSVNCFWMAERERDVVAKLHPGDSVTVLGRFSETGRYDMPKEYDLPGCAYYITLRNCTVKTGALSETAVSAAPSANRKQFSESDTASSTAAQPLPAATQAATVKPPTIRVEGFDGDIYGVGGRVSAPRVIYDPDPDYTQEARQGHYQGSVRLWLIVDTDGSTRNIRVARSLGHGLDGAAKEAVSRWRFEPATFDGRPVPVAINVDVNFKLN